ncbi:MAG: nucleotidyl transferase AbiEii/AbiGii toxin family protein [Bryobacterales bacterium]|nr:nucleotidyl transferase AbiEii/AbiGii toxin family protein [Bryobacterales bacterium]
MTYASDLKDFDDLVRATAADIGLPPDAVEKDYYVVRALQVLQGELAGRFLFKGGTSLSKGWGLIDRFSEDIDLLFRREHQGEPVGTKAMDRLLKQAQDAVGNAPGFTLKDSKASKGLRRASSFVYPRQHKAVAPIGDTVLLEMGCRGGTQPSQHRAIRAFVTGFLEKRGETGIAGDLTAFEVECLDVTRTFVEKLFAVCAAFARDRCTGRTRHYYDLYQLAELPQVKDFLQSTLYAEVYSDVRVFSEEHWTGSVYPPERNAGECAALTPTGDALAELTRNYARERDLFFKEPPLMKVILERLQGLPFPA